MALLVPITEIPSTSSLVLELAPSADEVAAMFDELGDFRLDDASSFSARVRLQRVGESVRISGHVAITLVYECGRCLSEREFEAQAELEYLVLPKSAYEATYGKVSAHNDEQDDEDGTELQLADLDVSYFEGDELDLRPYLREAILLETPEYASCALVGKDKECDQAYEALQEEAFKGKLESKIADPRWAPLLALQQQADKDKKD